MASSVKVRRDLALLLAIAASFAETGGVTLYANSLTCRSEVGIVRKELSSAFVTRNAQRLAAFYAEDALLRPPGRQIQGREAIVAYFIGRTDRRRLSHRLESESLEIDGVKAVDRGVWEASWQDPGQPVTSAHGRYLIVWMRNSAGIWRIAYESWPRPEFADAATIGCGAPDCIGVSGPSLPG